MIVAIKKISSILASTATPIPVVSGTTLLLLFSLFNWFNHYWNKGTFKVVSTWYIKVQFLAKINGYYLSAADGLIWLDLNPTVQKRLYLTQACKKCPDSSWVSDEPARARLEWISGWLAQLDWVGALHDSGRLGLAWRPAVESQGKPTPATAMAKLQATGGSITHRISKRNQWRTRNPQEPEIC